MKNYQKKIATLNITTWAGMSCGAEHYYGKIAFYKGGVDYTVEELYTYFTEEEAERNGKKDDWYYDTETPTSRFPSYKALTETAIRVYKKIFPEAEVLVITGYAQPHPVLDAPEESMIIEGNRLYNESELCGGWDEDEPRMEELCEEWNKLFGLKWA